MDKRTLRQFDEACLTPARSLTAAEIRALRERRGRQPGGLCSLPQRTPRGWLANGRGGEKHPQGPSLKLLSLVERGGLTAVA